MSARRWLVAGLLLLLVACSKDKDIDQPARLVPFSATLRVQKVWSAKVKDRGAQSLRLGLGIAVDGDRVFAAGHRGEVAAFDLHNGRLLWSKRAKEGYSGGPAIGAGLVVVGSSEGDLVALSETDGAQRWKTRLNGEVLAAPALSDRLIAVRTADGKLHGLSPKDGRELWTQEEQVPRLSLRGTAKPVLSGEFVLCGFDNGKVAAVNMGDGSIQWSTTIAPPHGKTELERLDDVDAAVRVSGSDVYAVGFQGRVAMLALETGQIWWSHEASSYRGLGLDEGALYLSTADGEIVALRRRTGTEVWRQKALLHRRLSAAVETDTSIVTTDFQGFVHWLDKATGAVQARARPSKVRVSNPPVAVGNMVLVMDDKGRLTAFRVTPIPGAYKPPPPLPAESTGTAAPEPGKSTEAAPAPSTEPNGTAAPQPSAMPPEPNGTAPQPDGGATKPGGTTSPESSTPPANSAPPPRVPPGTPPPPLPSQPTPDPTPPEPQTQPQPPPT